MKPVKFKWIYLGVALCIAEAVISCEKQDQIYIYNLTQKDSKEMYDEAIVVSCLQGIVNRKGPKVYVISQVNRTPDYWFKKFTSEGRWLQGIKTDTLENLDQLFDLARDEIKGAIIWDTNVPATVNVATTMAGVENGVVFSPDLARRYLDKWKLRVIKDLRGMFTGKLTGSAKNDAYRWAISNYLSKGLCNTHRVFLSEDAYTARDKGDIGYVVTRDWAVHKGSFVYDLSPWGDEQPQDDPDQIPGTDLETYKMMLSEILKQTDGKEMTEIAGFFAFSKYSNMPDHKSKHEAVPTEWESVFLMSPYNCYQNTVTSYCFNQSFHSQAPIGVLKQHRPSVEKKPENKTYICILMADYDSSTPLYEFLWKFWEDPHRGEIPFIWGLNPNLVETYPDIIEYLYTTVSDNDYFGADASAAGYMNPSRILPQYLSLFVEHNRKFYNMLDITISPMVLDWDEPSELVKDAFSQFSPDGFATIVYDFHNQKGKKNGTACVERNASHGIAQ
ncbi:MAG: GxGYxYP domain-containing protein [Mangrovibacterium sp.]